MIKFTPGKVGSGSFLHCSHSLSLSFSLFPSLSLDLSHRLSLSLWNSCHLSLVAHLPVQLDKEKDTYTGNPNPHQNSLVHSWHLHLSLCPTSALLHSVMCYAEYEWRRHWNRQGGAHTPSVNPTGTTRRYTVCVCVCVTLSVSYSIDFHHTDSYPFFWY